MTVIDEPVNTPAGWDARALVFDDPWTACGWSQESQQARFQAVLAALEPADGEWLLDYGCGTGDLAAVIPADVHYHGFDWSPEMTARARREHGDDTRRFSSRPPALGQRYDLVACIGTFNLPGGWSKDHTWHTVRHLWDTTGCRAIAVSLYSGDDDNCLIYTHDEAASVGRQLGFLTVVEDILPNDILLTVKR